MLAVGRTVGFRKIDDSRGTWIARLRDDTGKDWYHKLGQVTERYTYEDAKADAVRWFAIKDAGVTDDVVTVEAGCKAYVIDRRHVKGEATAHDAEKRFERTVYGRPFGALPMEKLSTLRIKTWRESLGLSPSSEERTLISWKAAMNLAVTNRQVSPNVAREWGDVKPRKGTAQRRDLFLDLSQRRALLGAARGAAHDLLQGAALTGARAGELVKALCRQFDPRTDMMKFSGK
ncbi:MAG: hypothetical protein ABI885_30455, partial [Gammaproteobacteria bacterium]